MQNFGNYNINTNTPIYVREREKKSVQKQNEDKSLGEKVAIGVASTAGAIVAILIGYGIINKGTGNKTKVTTTTAQATENIKPEKVIEPAKGDLTLLSTLITKIKNGQNITLQEVKKAQTYLSSKDKNNTLFVKFSQFLTKLLNTYKNTQENQGISVSDEIKNEYNELLNYNEETIAKLDEQDVNSQQLPKDPKEVVVCPSEDSSDNDSVVGGDNSSVVRDDDGNVVGGDEVDDFVNKKKNSKQSLDDVDLDDLDLDDLDPEVTATETNPEETKAEVTKAEETKEEEPKEAEPKEAEPKAAEPKEVTKEEPKEAEPKAAEPKEVTKEKPIEELKEEPKADESKAKPKIEKPKEEKPKVITNVDDIEKFVNPKVEIEKTTVDNKKANVYITDIVNGQEIKVKITDLIGNPEKLALLTNNKNFATIVANLEPSILVDMLNLDLFTNVSTQNKQARNELIMAIINHIKNNYKNNKDSILTLIRSVKNDKYYNFIIQKLGKIGILRDVLLDPNSKDRFFGEDNNLTDIGKDLINHIKDVIINFKEYTTQNGQTMPAKQMQIFILKNFITTVYEQDHLAGEQKNAIIGELIKKADDKNINLDVISCALVEMVRASEHQDSLTEAETQLINLITQRVSATQNVTPQCKGLLIANILKDIKNFNENSLGAALIEKLKESFGEEALYWALPYLVNSATSLCPAGNTIIQRINSNINNEHLVTILDVINANENNCATAVLYSLTISGIGNIEPTDLLYNQAFKEKLYSGDQLTPAGQAIITNLLIHYHYNSSTELLPNIAEKLIKINGEDVNFRNAIINELTTQCYQSNQLDLLNGIVKSLNENESDANKSVRNRVIDYMIVYGLIDLNTLNNMKDSLKGYNNFGISIDNNGKLTVNTGIYLQNIRTETCTSGNDKYNYKRISRKNIFFLLRHDTSLRKDNDFNDTGKNIFKKLFWNNNYEDKKNYRTDKYKIGYLSECLEDLDLTQENDRQLLLMLIKNSQITTLNCDIIPKLFADFIRGKKKIATDFKELFIKAILAEITSVTKESYGASICHNTWEKEKHGELLSEFLLNLIDTENGINEFLKEDGLVAETINQIKDQDLLVQLCLRICTYADTDKANNGIYTTKYEELTPTMKMIIEKLNKENYNSLIKKLTDSKNTNAINAKDCISKYRNTLNTTSS